MKKILSVILVLSLILLVACNPSTPKNDANSEANSYTIRVVDVCGPGSQYDYGTSYFKDRIEEATNGRVKVNTYHGDMTTDEVEGISMAQSGNLEILWTSTGSLSGYAPITEVMQLPFLFDGPEHLENCLEGEFGQLILNEVSKIDNLKAIAFHQDGWRNILTKGVVINSLEDAKNLRIRSMMSDMLVDMYKALGTVPVSVPYSELYTSLQTGMVSAQDNCLITSDADGFCEQLNSGAIVNHFYAAGMAICSESWLNSLTKEDQELIIETAKEAGKKQREWMLNQENILMEEYKAKGWTFTYPSDVDSWREAVKPVYDKYLEKHPDWKKAIDIVDNLR